jgi:hypothetical protein
VAIILFGNLFWLTSFIELDECFCCDIINIASDSKIERNTYIIHVEKQKKVGSSSS